MVSLALETILLLDSKNIDIGKCEPSLFYTYMVSMDSFQCPLSLSKDIVAPLCKLKKREFIRSINRSDVERNNRSMGKFERMLVLRTLDN